MTMHVSICLIYPHVPMTKKMLPCQDACGPRLPPAAAPFPGDIMKAGDIMTAGELS